MSRSNSDADITHAGGVVRKASPKGSLYLLVRAKRNPNQWIFPKGHVESGETLGQAACREVREEAGVLAKPVELLDILDLPEGRLALFLMAFEAAVGSMEDREVIWCSFDESLAYLSFPESRNVLSRARLIEEKTE